MMIEIDGAHSGIRFSACHFIPGHEKCSRLHGHSYIIRARLEGDVGASGMVMDFVEIKKALKAAAEEMDHKTLLPRNTDNVRVTETAKDVEVLTCGKRYVFPKEDVLILDIDITTAEEMSRLMAKKLLSVVKFPKNVKRLWIGLDEERGQTAWYSEAL
ncbi:MAG: 6-pyruvoyl tetrahydropterin synthase family protein [Methanomassiliicoccaceae archaeon]|jgi:6-pyruvoyltetrahydropterin/6-carboxytetrahydropterin synthase|nr:6-pyruvoyl tetrahydropterin synthase family protein [Methanomassiliicoccaceae archaeon]